MTVTPGYSAREATLEQRLYDSNERLLEALQRGFERLSREVAQAQTEQQKVALSLRDLDNLSKKVNDMGKLLTTHIEDCVLKAEHHKRQYEEMLSRLERRPSIALSEWLTTQRLVIILAFLALIAGVVSFDEIRHFLPGGAAP